MNRTPVLLLIILFSLSGMGQSQTRDSERFDTKGLDMELLSYGGSLGGFYSFHPSAALSLDVESDWSLIESNDTFAYYDYYNRPVTVNNRNLSFVKLLGGVTWFPFLETMHPSLQVGTFAAIGPVLSLNTADDETLLERWKEVETDLALMSRAGLHLRVLTGQGSSYNFRIGYDYARFDKQIDENQTYKGLFFQVGMEFLHR